jgi:hypothetical protein
MRVWFLLLVCVATINTQELNLFGIGRASQRLYLAEVIINSIKVYL